jgi:hypothetical protein
MWAVVDYVPTLVRSASKLMRVRVQGDRDLDGLLNDVEVERERKLSGSTTKSPGQAAAP